MIKTELEIPRYNGKLLNANLFSIGNPPNKTSIVILCHGFTGDQSEWGRFPTAANELNKNGYDALTFDFSGSGKNQRECITLTKQIKDLEDVFGWVKSNGYKKISTIGLSFGGMTSLLSNLPERITAIFWAPAFYFNRKLGKFKIFIAKLACLFKINFIIKRESGVIKPILIDSSFLIDNNNKKTNKAIEELRIPILIIHGSDDHKIPPKWSKEAFLKMPQDDDHNRVVIPEANHDFKDHYLMEFIKHSINWLNKYHLKF